LDKLDLDKLDLDKLDLDLDKLSEYLAMLLFHFYPTFYNKGRIFDYYLDPLFHQGV